MSQPPSSTKPVWVLLRGLMRQQGHWGHLPKQLEKQLNAEVYCLDIAGCGQYFQQQSATSISAMLSQVRSDLLNRYQANHHTSTAPQELNLLAISMGGMIATQWAQQFPAEIQHMVLINTSFKNFSPFYTRFNPRFIPKICLAAIRSYLTKNPAFIEQLVFNMTCNQSISTTAQQKLLTHWQEIASQQPVSWLNALRQLYAASQFKAPQHQPNTKVLLLASKQDRLVSMQCSQTIQHAWQCPCQYHVSAGHDLPLDDPPWLLQQLHAFITTEISASD